jgi:hypothetical protein
MRCLGRGLRGRLVRRPAAGLAWPLHQRIPRHVALPHRPLVEPVHRGDLTIPRRTHDPRTARILSPPLLERRPILGCSVPPRRPVTARRQKVEPLLQVIGNRRLRVLRTAPQPDAGEIPVQHNVIRTVRTEQERRIIEQSTLVEPPVQVAQLAHKRNDRTRLRQPALGEEDPPAQDRHTAPYPALRSRRSQTSSHRRVRVNGQRGATCHGRRRHGAYGAPTAHTQSDGMPTDSPPCMRQKRMSLSVEATARCEPVTG